MPDLFRKPGLLRWFPDAAANDAPPGALLRADNLEFVEPTLARLRRGISTIYSGLGTTVHSLYTALIDGIRYRIAGVDDKVYINGVDSGVTFDGSGDISICSWLGHIFMARGSVKKKFDGSIVTNWGIPKPGNRLSVEPGATIQEYFSTCNQAESPAWTAQEGTITGTYPDGSDGIANGSIELTPAATGRATITRTLGADTDYLNVDGYNGSDTDLIDLQVWFDKPQEVESVTLMFGCSETDVSDPFRDDYYQTVFKMGGQLTTAPQEPVIIKSNQAIAKQAQQVSVLSKVSDEDVSTGRDGRPDPIPLDPSKIPPPGPTVPPDPIDNSVTLNSRLRTNFRDDASYNPGWNHLTVSRGACERIGSNSDRGWDTIRAIRIIFKELAGSSGKGRFDTFQVLGGGDRSLVGEFAFTFQQSRAMQAPDKTFEFLETSPPADPSDFVRFNQQLVQLRVAADLLETFDPQTNQLLLYMTGGYLDDWYLVGVSGAEANQTSMSIDEFASSPDGNISAFDRARLNLVGFSIPGDLSTFAPSDIAGLKCWLSADDIDVASGAGVTYWPGKVAYAAFTPTDITSIKGWWKSDTGVYSDAGVTAAVDGDTIRQWNDQSGGGNNYSQATGGNKPVFKTGIVNGKPVVRFDGVDDYLQGAILSSFFGIYNGCVYVVFKPDTISGVSANPYSNQALWGDAGPNAALSLHATSGLQAFKRITGPADNTASKTGIAANLWTIGVYASNASGGTDIADNTDNLGVGVNSSSWYGMGTVGTFDIADRTQVTYFGRSSGAASYFDGDIAEIIVFNELPTSLERLKLERYLANRYGISAYAFDPADVNIPARQETTASKPVLVKNWLNSHAGVLFDGSNDILEICANLGDVMTNSAYTVFIVGQASSVVGAPGGAGSVDNNTLICSRDSKAFILQCYDSTSLKTQSHNNDGSDDFTGARAAAANSQFIWTVQHSAGTLYSGQNDTRTASMNSAASGNTAATTGALRLGGLKNTGSANKEFNGYIAEVLIFNVAVSEANRQKIESYLASKYGLAGSIPYALVTSFVDSGESSDDLLITLSASEINARLGNNRLPPRLSRPPDDLISIDAPYADRLWMLTSGGMLYFTERRQPGSIRFYAGFKVGDSANESFWVRITSLGVYVGTAKDITWIYGTGAENLDGTYDFRKVSLNVADPPINGCVTTDGNSLIYMAARGPMVLDNNQITPVPLGGTELLWRGETRHGVSGVNIDGRFQAAVTHGDFYLQVPEGASDASSPAIYKKPGSGDAWRRFSYPRSWACLYREPDGTLLAGSADGRVIEIETGTQDDGVDIDIVKWTPFEDANLPLNRKEGFDLSLRGDTGGSNLAIAVHKDGSAVAALTLTANLNGVGSYLDDLAALGVARSCQLRMTGSFSQLNLINFNMAYRSRPQHRVYFDTGPLRNSGEALVWYRVARICMEAESDVTLDFYFDGVLHDSKDVTVTANKVLVYEIPLGREYKGRQPKVIVRKKDGASTVADAGFEIQWLELRQHRTGNLTSKDLRKVFPDNPGTKIQESEQKAAVNG